MPDTDVTGAGLAKTIKDTLITPGLNLLNHLRGQVHDGAAAIQGAF